MSLRPTGRGSQAYPSVIYSGWPRRAESHPGNSSLRPAYETSADTCESGGGDRGSTASVPSSTGTRRSMSPATPGSSGCCCVSPAGRAQHAAESRRPHRLSMSTRSRPLIRAMAPVLGCGEHAAGTLALRGDGPTQYVSLSADGTRAELIRNERLTTEDEIAMVSVQMWAVAVNQAMVVDYSTFERAETAGFDPEALVDEDWAPCQQEGARLRGLNYGGSCRRTQLSRVRSTSRCLGHGRRRRGSAPTARVLAASNSNHKGSPTSGSAWPGAAGGNTPLRARRLQV